MTDKLHQLLLLIGPWWAAIGGSALLSMFVATIANAYRDPDHNPETPPPVWVQLCDQWLAWAAPRGHVGVLGTRLSVPGVRSKRRKPKGPAPLPPAAALAFFLLGFQLVGCGPVGRAYTQCLLGSLPSSAQTILVDATQALTGQNWEANLASIAATVGADALNCTVAAIVAARQQAMDAQIRALVDSSVRMAPPVDFVLEHGRAWMAKHPAKACGETSLPPTALSWLGSHCTESPGIREVTCRDLLGNEVSFQGTLRLVEVSQ